MLSEITIHTAYYQVLSLVASTGHFEDVLGHELTAAGPPGLIASQWVDYLGPAIGSGLASTDALLVVNVRIEATAFVSSREAADAMDPKIFGATTAVFSALAADLTLGGTARTIDVRGISGRRLESRAGYMERDRTLKRLSAITVPVIIDDAWIEVL